MLRNLITRRRREDARVERFLHAIELSARYSVNPDWSLQSVPDDAPAAPPAIDPMEDTLSIPRIILTAGATL
jgi:hypothetical protein